jgi:solute carrier family 35 protein F5
MFGDALALISALFGAICVIYLKVQIKDESRVDMLLFYGFLGLFNLLLLWPIGLILHLTGAENFGLPRSSQDLYAIITNVRHLAPLPSKKKGTNWC